MPQDPWQHRIERAEQLAQDCTYATEILRFYKEIATFQRDLHRLLEKTSTSSQQSSTHASAPPELTQLQTSFPKFLQMVEKRGSRPLAAFATTLLTKSPAAHAELLDRFWTDKTSHHGLEEFTAQAFLQPYAEFVRSRSDLEYENYTQSPCPFCARKPGLGILRPLGDGGRRFLVCSFCLAEWPFRRILCAGCGEEDHRKLPVYTAEELAHLRVECCDTCRQYLITVDLTKNGLAVPVVDEMAAIPLDLWAREKGYSKIAPNLMQI